MKYNNLTNLSISNRRKNSVKIFDLIDFNMPVLVVFFTAGIPLVDLKLL